MQNSIFFLHPYLISIHQTLFLLAHNAAETDLYKAVYPVIIVFIITAAALFIYPRLAPSNRPETGAAAISVFWLFFFCYGPSETLLSSYFHLNAGIFFLIIWFAALFYAIKKIINSTADFNKINIILNFIAAVLIILPIFNILIYMYNSTGEFYIPDKSDAQSGIKSKKELTRAEKPDIYHIVLDGYARNDVLKKIYNFDNSDFTEYLSNKGFFIAEKSYANYATFTAHSLASFLNYNYYDILIGNEYKKQKSFNKLNDLIQHNAAAKFLRSAGYEFISFHIIDAPIKTADVNLKPDSFYRGLFIEIYSDPFYNLLINKTPLSLFYRHISNEFDFSLSEGIRTLTSYMFDTVKNLGGRKKPAFVYAHFPIPHPPFVFDENGKDFAGWKYFNNPFGDADILIKNKTDRENYIKFYINQIKFVNKKTIKMIDGILKNSKKPPVIILQSDHGPGSNFSFNNINALTPEGLFERYAILNAYYLRGTDFKNNENVKKTGIYKKITPVNTYRIIFNEYFGTNLKLLKDRCFYAPVNDPYNFNEIEIK